MKPENAIQLLRAAEGDEEKLTLNAVEIAIAARPGIPPGQLRDAVYAAAVPVWFDAASLGALLDIPVGDAKGLYAVIRRFAFVENFAGRNASGIHERTRLGLLRWLMREQADRFCALSRRAAEYCQSSREPHVRISWIYHLLVAEPVHSTRRLAALCDEWTAEGRFERLQTLAAAVGEHLAENRLAGPARAAALEITATIEARYQSLTEIENRLGCALDLYRELGDETAESVVLSKIGGVQREDGRFDDALQSLKLSLAIRQRLAALDPRNFARQQDLSDGYARIGEVQLDQGYLEAALQSFQTALAIHEKLAADDPANVEWQRGVSQVHDWIGEVHRMSGRGDAALGSFHTALMIREHLAGRDPANTEWQRELSMSHDHIGGVQRDQGRLADAERSFETALAIREKLTAPDPRIPGRSCDLQSSFRRA